MRIKISRKHSKSCCCIRPDYLRRWKVPWALLGVPYEGAGAVKLTRKGGVSHATKRNSTEYWLRAVCNDPTCKAVAFVAARDIETLLPVAIR